MGTAGRYASGTDVSSDRSKAEIERTLTRYGATSFIIGWETGRAAVGFEYGGRRIRFVLPLPDRAERRFTHTPTTGKVRSAAQADTAYEQAVRQKWRALLLIVKAKLEAVESGVAEFEAEFFAYIVLPSGRTVYEEAAPVVEQAYLTGAVAPLLQLGDGR